MALTGILIGWLCLLLLFARLAGRPVPPARPPRATYPALTIAMLAISLVILRRLWGYTADDAYIIVRYAANLAHRGQAVFNLGEPVNAITTPLAMLVMAALHVLGPDQVMGAYKTLCLALHGGALILVLRALGGSAGLSLFVALVSLSPFHSLWLAGGLETPLLELELLLIALLLTRREREGPDPAPGVRVSLAVAALAALAFATRYDSVLFTAPLLLWLLVRQRRRSLALAVAALAVLPPLGLLLANRLYYGDPLPTSFYLKTAAPLDWEGFVYVVEFFLYSGILPCALHLVAARTGGDARGRWGPLADPRAAMWAGLFVVSVPYATLTATSHMMYGFRAFVPYLAVMGWLLAREVEDRAAPPGLPLLVVLVALLQVSTALILPTTSLGAARVGEFRAFWDIPTYLSEIERGAEAVEVDWRRRGGRETLRVYSPNEGLSSTVIPDAAFYGRLTGYRRRCPVHLPEYARASHYAIVEEPFVGLHLRGIDLSGWELVYRGRPFSRGHRERQQSRVLVYRNPHPEARDFGYGVDDPCPEPLRRRQPG